GCSSSGPSTGAKGDAAMDASAADLANDVAARTDAVESPLDVVALLDGVTPGDDAVSRDGLLSSDAASDAAPADVAAPSDAARDGAGPEAACEMSACAIPLCRLGPSADAGACAASPARADSDGDGLSDAWEQAGFVDLNCDGVLDAGDIPLPGADPQRKD